MPAFDPSDVRSFEDAFWAAVADTAEPGQRRALLSRLLSSPEFNAVRSAWRAAAEPHPPNQPVDASGFPGGPGDDEGFVRVAYEALLARPADEGGLRHYLSALANGETRAGVVRALALSDEFERRSAGVPEDNQLCELANPAKWDNEEWLGILRSLGLADDKLAMHRKPYEFTQLIFGCRRLGHLHDEAAILSVGAGHELVLYWLANHAGRVVATDLLRAPGSSFRDAKAIPKS